MHKPTLTLRETAQALSVAEKTFRSDRPRLEAAGFPKPLPALSALIWSRAQVEAWIAANGDPAPAENAAVKVLPFVAAARQSLSDRYGRRA